MGRPSTSQNEETSCWDDQEDTEPTLNRKATLTVIRGFLTPCPFHVPLLIKQLLQHKTKHKAKAPILSAALWVSILKPWGDPSSFH